MLRCYKSRRQAQLFTTTHNCKMKCALLFIVLPAVVLANNYGQGQQRVQTPVHIPGKVPVRPGGSGYGGAQALNQGQRNPTGYGNQGAIGTGRGNQGGYGNQGPIRGAASTGYGANQGPIRVVPANNGYGGSGRPNAGYANQNQGGRIDPVRPGGGYGQGGFGQGGNGQYTRPNAVPGRKTGY